MAIRDFRNDGAGLPRRPRMPSPGVSGERAPEADRRHARYTYDLQELRALQRWAGNKAVMQLLSGASSPSAPGGMRPIKPVGADSLRQEEWDRAQGNAAPVQRAKLNLRQAGTISGVSAWPSRPPSNLRSGQGQHLTAYVAFEQMILSHVRDRTPQKAADTLIALIADIKILPSMVPRNQYNDFVHNGLDNVVSALSKAKGQDAASAAKVVGAEIDNILVYRNQVPGTAISIPGTKGHGEATTAGSLEEIETGLREGRTWDDQIALQAVKCMWSLFDYDPPPPGDKVILEAISRRVLTHILSMRMAFPGTWRWLSGKNQQFHLLPYLIQHLGDPTLPLPRLDKKVVEKVKTHVYENM